VQRLEDVLDVKISISGTEILLGRRITLNSLPDAQVKIGMINWERDIYSGFVSKSLARHLKQILPYSGSSEFKMLSFSLTTVLALAAGVSAGSIKDIKHVVLFMQENRAFDHVRHASSNT
jgi:hypothetical protein